MRKHYKTEEEAIDDLDNVFGPKREDASSWGWTTYRFVAGILTMAVPYGRIDDEPRLLLNENEGLYWEVPDA